MSNVINMYSANQAAERAQKHTDRVIEKACKKLAEESPKDWLRAFDVARVLTSCLRNDGFGGQLFNDDNGVSQIFGLSALAIYQQDDEEVAEFFALAIESPEELIGKMIDMGMPVAEKNAGFSGGAA